MKPLAIDLFGGLGGWAEGFLAEGYTVVGFDVERHRYAKPAVKLLTSESDEGETSVSVEDATTWDEYPGQLVIQDVTTLHGSQFRDAAVIVASPPCQEYSYMAMPWSRAKKIAAEYRDGARSIADLTRLFDACFRIQREACEAAGHHISLVVENVKGAQPWVGRAAWHLGSFYLWGDVPALMPAVKHHKVGIKQSGHSGRKWFADPDVAGHFSSASPARKAASAQIAKIPLALARHIAQCYFPTTNGLAPATCPKSSAAVALSRSS